MTIPEAIYSLLKLISFGLGPQPTQQQMLTVIEKVESQYPNSNSAELESLLGCAWGAYGGLFIRGDERKIYYEMDIKHREKAFAIAKDCPGADWQKYAAGLGKVLVERVLIKDFERGIPLLDTVFQASRDYMPSLCSYAEAIFKTGDFQKAAAVATELHRRAKESEKCKFGIPPAPMRIAAMAYRAHIKQLKKEGNPKEAFVVSEKLIQTGVATDNDQRIHEKLATLAGKS